ncbi:uncharacterized protein J3R85_016877 [Psidium guajava]|nr:uncharacterized protein J3R85_016877 [Psidium guajava]
MALSRDIGRGVDAGRPPQVTLALPVEEDKAGQLALLEGVFWIWDMFQKGISSASRHRQSVEDPDCVA